MQKLACWIFFICLALSQSQTVCSSAEEAAAKLTETHGSVYKRGFVDWSKEIWDEPQPAQKGDLLNEGMQIGTGDKSWAQLSWKYITARAWANSIYAIAPNQRLVYLLGGEMLYHLNKRRKDKSDYFVWTKHLQARIHGTSVLFQSVPGCSRLSVLEGTVTVMNRSDHNVVQISPGTVYEVLDKQSLSANPGAGAAPVLASSRQTPSANQSVTNAAAPNGAASRLLAGTQIQSIESLLGVAASEIQAIPLFETKKTLTSLYVVNTQALLSHPLLTSFEQPLASEALIKQSLSEIDPNLSAATGGNAVALKSALNSSVQIVSVPKSMSYNVGAALGSTLNLPKDAFSYFPPLGYIAQPGLAPANANFGLAPLAKSGLPALTPALSNQSLNGSVSKSATVGSAGMMPGAALTPTGITPGFLPAGVTGLMPGTLPAGITGITPGTLPSGITGITPGSFPGVSPGGAGSMLPGMPFNGGGSFMNNLIQSTLGGSSGLLGH